MNYLFTFTFYKVGNRTDPRLLQQVTVRADSARQAWKTFEAVYPCKFFTAFKMQTLT